jgi:hypothetical protein
MGSGASDRKAEATPTSGNAYIRIFREHSGRQAVGDPPHPRAKYGFTEKPRRLQELRGSSIAIELRQNPVKNVLTRRPASIEC